MRTCCYIDGFNLYYSALKYTKLKWLNVRALMERSFPENDIVQIRYFTANIHASPEDPSQPQRQQAYIYALKSLADVSIHRGQFRVSVKKLREANTGHLVEVRIPQEKGSDVNLASHLLMDCFENRCDAVILVSNDSDQVCPLRFAKRELGKRVGVLFPRRESANRELKKYSHFHRFLSSEMLEECQFPNRVLCAHGWVTKPAGW